MKAKCVFMLMALVGSTALVAFAQQAAPHRDADKLPPLPSNHSQTFYTPEGGKVVYPVPMYPGQAWHGQGTSPEEANLAQEADHLARQLGEARSDTDRDKLKAKLGEILEKQFDQRQRRHEGEIDALERQVKKLKELVQRRQENRREIISRRLEQLLRESQGLGW
jgi:hypothetical protein